MNIGVTLRKLRRERDMTQEQLAEYVNVSAQAVSRWETGAALPDIAQLPVLAHIFDVTTDTLLGVDIAAKEAKIEQIAIDTWENYSAKGRGLDAIEILRGALKEYPNSYRLMGRLAFELHHNQEKQPNFSNDEVIALCEKVLAECTDDSIRHSMIQTLCYAYKQCGEHDKTISLATKMPTTVLSREHLLCETLRGTKRYERRQSTIHSDMDTVLRYMRYHNITLDSGDTAYNLDEYIALQHKVLDMYNILYEDGNCGFDHCRLMETHRHLSFLYMKKGDEPAALKHLRQAANHAIIFDKESRDTNLEYTCLLFRGMKQYEGYSSSSPDNNASELLNEYLIKPELDPIRQHPEFIAIEDELRKNAGPRWLQ